MVNKWRGRIDLEQVAMFDGPMLAEALKVPFTYCWSPALVPKPKDWGPHIGQSVSSIQKWRSCHESVFIADSWAFQMFAASSFATRPSTSRLLI